MISQLLQLGLFTCVLSLGAFQPQFNNSIGSDEDGTYLQFRFGLTPTSYGRDNPEVYSCIDFKINQEYTITYDIFVYDDSNALLFDSGDLTFSITNWNLNELSNIHFSLYYHRDHLSSNYNVNCDTITWSARLDKKNGLNVPRPNFLEEQFVESDVFYSNNIDNEYYFDLPIDLIYSYFNQGYQEGYDDGKTDGYTEGYSDGYDEGYYQGYYYGNLDGTNSQINFLGLFGAIADTPVLILRNLLGFDLFGTSALTIFMSLLTVCVVIHFIRKFL